MLSYFLRRLLILLPMLLLITFLIYFAMDALPGDAVSYMISPEQIANTPPEALKHLREALGLNQPFLVRYGKWLVGIFQGNFGYSLTSGVPISQIVMEKLPATLELSGAALLISTVFGVGFGVISALKQNRLTDNVLSFFGIVGVSTPSFFFGLLLIVIFALNLGWLPVGGRMSPGDVTFFDRLSYLIMPATVLGLGLAASTMRYSRSSMLDAKNKEFIRTARSKGTPEWKVNLLHGFRVAINPVVVHIGFQIASLLGGAVITETIFNWPGIGSAFVTAVRGSNYPLVMMIALITVSAVLVASFLVDLVSALLDPRVRLE